MAQATFVPYEPRRVHRTCCRMLISWLLSFRGSHTGIHMWEQTPVLLRNMSSCCASCCAGPSRRRCFCSTIMLGTTRRRMGCRLVHTTTQPSCSFPHWGRWVASLPGIPCRAMQHTTLVCHMHSLCLLPPICFEKHAAHRHPLCSIMTSRKYLCGQPSGTKCGKILPLSRWNGQPAAASLSSPPEAGCQFLSRCCCRSALQCIAMHGLQVSAIGVAPFLREKEGVRKIPAGIVMPAAPEGNESQYFCEYGLVSFPMMPVLRQIRTA